MSAEKRELDDLEKQIKDPKTPEATRKKLRVKHRKLSESLTKRGDPPKAPQVALGKGWASKKAIDQGEGAGQTIAGTASGWAGMLGKGKSEGDWTQDYAKMWEKTGDPVEDAWQAKQLYKHGGRIKKPKKKTKKRKRAALRGHRSELRGS